MAFFYKPFTFDFQKKITLDFRNLDFCTQVLQIGIVGNKCGGGCMHIFFNMERVEPIKYSEVF